jgi:diguanylate cyclase (GGDEF)-like protein
MPESETPHDRTTASPSPAQAGPLHGLLRLKRHLARLQAEAHLLSADAQSALQELAGILRQSLALGELGKDRQAGNAPDPVAAQRALHLLWSGGDARVVEPLLAGLTGHAGWPRITLTSDLRGGLAQLDRERPDLWMVTPCSQAEVDELARQAVQLDSPPVVVVLAPGPEAFPALRLHGGSIECVSQEQLTPELLRELATRARVRRSFIENLSEAQKRVEELVHRDALTGLHNRRYFESRLAIEVARATRFGESLTLVLIDVDHFKEINDTHGHPAGDQVLVQTGHLLQSAVRQIDLVARVGGEEFALLLPNTGAVGAPGLVGRLIDRVRKHRFGTAQCPIQVTLSAGIAACPEDGCVGERALYEHADRALYQAKRRGRDRLEVYDPATDF